MQAIDQHKSNKAMKVMFRGGQHDDFPIRLTRGPDPTLPPLQWNTPHDWDEKSVLVTWYAKEVNLAHLNEYAGPNAIGLHDMVTLSVRDTAVLYAKHMQNLQLEDEYAAMWSHVHRDQLLLNPMVGYMFTLEPRGVRDLGAPVHVNGSGKLRPLPDPEAVELPRMSYANYCAYVDYAGEKDGIHVYEISGCVG